MKEKYNNLVINEIIVEDNFVNIHWYGDSLGDGILSFSLNNKGKLLVEKDGIEDKLVLHILQEAFKNHNT